MLESLGSGNGPRSKRAVGLITFLLQDSESEAAKGGTKLEGLTPSIVCECITFIIIIIIISYCYHSHSESSIMLFHRLR